MLAACSKYELRLVLADNLYMYGPQDAELTETLPLTKTGRKPRARAEATRLWQLAHETQRARVVSVRAPDFYGPGVEQSILGTRTIGALAKGRRAVLLERPIFAHDVAHVRDFARAVVTLVDAPDDAFGQAWHVPCDKTRTLRELLQIAADELDATYRITVLPPFLTQFAGIFSPPLREVDEMRFLFDRPYRVNWEKFKARFWSDPIPINQGIAETARWFQRNGT
ncbi:hypothetical protein ABAC402_16655 [Asticcacaulis sp. AC402]|nr:hypothetical protein ABAC402_16655 [Asticcacaulis sp. AC402]